MPPYRESLTLSWLELIEDCTVKSQVKGVTDGTTDSGKLLEGHEARFYHVIFRNTYKHLRACLVSELQS